MYHSRIAHDPNRCTAQRLRINILGNNGIRCWDEHVSLGCTTLASANITCALVQVKNRNFFASCSWDNVVIRVTED